MRLDLDEPAFRSMICRWLAGLSDDTLLDINAVFEQSPGVYPTTLLPLWRSELRKRGLAPAIPVQRQSSGCTMPDPLPVAHPVHAEWRFTPESAKDLVGLAVAELPPTEAVLHIGTPSTFLFGVFADHEHRHILVDQSAPVIDALANQDVKAPHAMIGVDLLDVSRMYFSAGSAILDPPWYVDDTLAFVEAAQEACRLNATILLCQPMLGTRPGVAQERESILRRVALAGLKLDRVLSGAVRYMMPHFEASALRAEGLNEAVPATWRRGDVLVLRTTGSPKRPRVDNRQKGWREVKFGPVRIMLAAHPTGPDLGDLAPGDVLSTVSRRDPRRARIGFWTSGNRVFTIADPARVGELVEMCHIDLMNEQFTLDRTISHSARLGVDRAVAGKLYRVLKLELEEHRTENT